MSEKYNVSKEEKIRQAEFADKVKTVLAAEFYECSPKAFIVIRIVVLSVAF